MVRPTLLRALVALVLAPVLGCAGASPVPVASPASEGVAAQVAAPEALVDTLPPGFDAPGMTLPHADGDLVTEPAAPVVEGPAAPTFRAPVVARDRTHVVVLEYHALGDLEDPMFVPAAAFEEQMAWLADHHVEVVRTRDLTAWLDGRIELPAVAALITIDDAHKSARRVALPILARRGMPFTLALNTAAVEEQRAGAMSWDDVREVMKSGLCELASHSHIHGFMAKMTDASNRRELELSRALIEEHTGSRPTAFVFPFGSISPRLVKLTEEAGYDVAFAAWGPAVAAASPRFRLGRFGVTREMDVAAFARPFRDAAHAKAVERAAVAAR